MDIIKINALDHQHVENQIIELECQNPFNCINCKEERPAYSWECEIWKKKSNK